ncbi:response regulator transcription factor [Paludibaculum fermentans]|uniref:Response regulator transcription factor n=1 Tax=Paludibaculum fermentans TaxID=1473598 RepID=A0A7S7SHG7_PALFE|nr:response regulator [Paludibaculum fermentans]QOY85897.1 response regulator transcription factor [Paludibaculum fermentans]
MKAADEVVYVLDDDHRIREALSEVFAAMGMPHVSFGSATEYLRYRRTDACACLILDVDLPDINGLDLQRQLGEDIGPPIIFLSGYGDIPSTVRAMKAGAVEFLTKPADHEMLLGAIRTAFTRDLQQRQRVAEIADLQRRFALLTPREKEVLPLIADGMLNKQAAAALGISEVTLQVHRGQIMRKMSAASFADLVRMAFRLAA